MYYDEYIKLNEEVEDINKTAWNTVFMRKLKGDDSYIKHRGYD
jgi:hypothetical protein